MTRVFLFLAAVGLSNQASSPNAYAFADQTRLKELASKIWFEPLTRADGISLGTVVRIFQDHRGLLWFSTRNGLNRYDGYQTVLYTDVPMDLSGPIPYPGLPYEGRDGSLWVGTQVLSLYRPGAGAVTRFVPTPRASLSSWPQKIGAIHEDNLGFIWLGVSNFQLSREISDPVLYRFDPRTGVSSEYRMPAAITQGTPGAIRAIEHDRSGKLWLGTSYGLIGFDTTTGLFKAYFHTHPSRTNPLILPEFTFNTLVWDRDGKLWVHMPGGLERFDPETGSFDRFQGVNFWFMPTDTEGIMWLCGGSPGVKLFDPRTGKLLPVPDFGDAREEDPVSAVLRDRAGNVWAYFSRSGLQRYTAASPRFGKVIPDPANAASLARGSVQGFLEDRAGRIWISTLGSGLNRFDPATGIFRRLPGTLGSHDGLPSNWIQLMYEDREGAFFLGAAGRIGRFDRESRVYTHLATLPKWITSILEDRDGRFWVGNGLGRLHLLDRKTGVVTATEVNGGYVSHEDRSGNLWFGYPPGLTKLDPTGTTHSISLLQRPDGSGPENVMVQTIYEDREGILWLATQSGLFRFDPKSEKSIVYTNRDGLADIDIRCALGDGQGNVWLSTASGLSRFDLQEKRFYNYDERDGLQGSRFLGRSCFQTRDGKLFFGGTNGFNAFYPRDILATAPEAPVVLTDFTISGRGTAAISKPIFDSVTMKLSPKQDGFSIGFAALSYVNPSRTRYRFKLEGHETQWVQADSEHRFARYTNVPSGDYVFRVQAATDGFHWGNNEASLHLTLAPSWWNTPWGTSAILLASATLIFGAHKLRVKALEQRERRLGLLVERRTAELVEARDQAQAASRAKSKFLAHMSHELRNPLSSILLLSHLLKEEVASQEQHDYLDLIDRSGEHLLTLINDVLEVTKIESGKQEVVATPCDLVTLVQEVTDIVRVKADSKKLTLTCATTADLRPYVRTDAPKLRQVLLNLLGNAIKFTDAGGVTLRFGTIGPDDSGLLKLRFEVADTGDGIAIEDQARIFEPFVQAGKLAGQTGTGLGLTITRQFVEMMGGTIALESVPGRGSRFTVEVPSEVVPESEVAGVASVARSRFVLEPGQPECRVLVVDDEPENAMIMELMLRRAGFRVQVARSGTEGIEVFEEWNPQFIWMDLRMPEFSGAEAARHIRKLQGGREVRIAALTAAAFASERDEVMAAGMDDFVRKPYHTDEIFDCMARQLGLRYQHIQTEGHGESEAGESSQA